MTCEPEFANHLSKLSSLWDIAIVSYEYTGVKILRLITHFLTYILYTDTYSWEVKYICQRPYFYTRQYLYLIFFPNGFHHHQFCRHSGPLHLKILIRSLANVQTNPFFPGPLRHSNQKPRIRDSGHNTETHLFFNMTPAVSSLHPIPCFLSPNPSCNW